MTIIERINKIETEITIVKKIVSVNTFKNGDFINGIKIEISSDLEDIVSSYWFGFDSNIEREIVDLYLKGLTNSLESLLLQAKREVDKLNLILKKYES